MLKRLNAELGADSIQRLRLVRGDVPAEPRHAESEAAPAAVWKPSTPLPDPLIKAAHQRQAQRMPHEPAIRTGTF